MDVEDLTHLVADMRAEGSDFAQVEVKRAAGGFPENLAPTFSAFGNTPGGGLLIFGLDEVASFAATGVYDVAACKKAIASTARQVVQPPVVVAIESVVFEGADLVIATVAELPGSAKPCRVRSTGRAYLRSYDGDYPLSDLEEQAFVANRSTPRFDQQPVDEATADDLDTELVDAYVETASDLSPVLRRFGRDELLFRTGVLVGKARVPSLAGLLALGVYPQQFFPNLVIQASSAPRPDAAPGTRVDDARRFDGPLPLMLEEAVRWVARNSRTRIKFDEDGHGRDAPEYPLVAVRELLSNALIHRDLGPYALGEAITLRITDDQLIVSNPGGLFGISVARLGSVGVTSARNGYLVRICQNVRTGQGGRVVEALATGIPTVLEVMSGAGMVPPRFQDQGIKFAVRVPNHALLSRDDVDWLARVTKGVALSDTQRHVLARMRHSEVFTNKSLRDAFPMDSRDAGRLLSELVAAGLAEARGERGGRLYALDGKLTGQRSELDDSGTTIEPEALILGVLREGPTKRAEIERRTGLTYRQVQYALHALRESGSVELKGTPGSRTSVYTLTS
ncbi:ATP-binding protein [Pseudonocardia phyllosphaerae]|uniref:ATP-binding protein n=1 Tax=Pseudonocardia phyllosphaerae TaxID=3390502 RepID=UPI003978364C